MSIGDSAEEFDVLWLTTRADEDDPVWIGLDRKASQASIQVRRVTSTPGQITQLVVGHWVKDGDGWLVFHARQSPHMLAVQFPLSVDSTRITTYGRDEVEYYASQAEEVLFPGRNLYALILREGEFSEFSFGLFGEPQLVQHIRANPAEIRAAIDSLARHSKQQQDGAHARIAEAIEAVNERLTDARRTKISQALATKRQSERSRILEELDNTICAESLGLAELISGEFGDGTGSDPVIDSFLAKYSDVLDKESLAFLRSSSTLLWYAHRIDTDDFDYALAASGIWKALEREVNSTIIGKLRIHDGLASPQDVWSPLGGVSTRVPYKSKGYSHKDRTATQGPPIDIAKLERRTRRKTVSSRFGNITLGALADLMRGAEDNGVSRILEEFAAEVGLPEQITQFALSRSPSGGQSVEEGLIWLLDDSSDIRNEHAHISKMSKKVAEELETLVLAEGDDPESLSRLAKILEIKKYMQKKNN